MRNMVKTRNSELSWLHRRREEGGRAGCGRSNRCRRYFIYFSQRQNIFRVGLFFLSFVIEKPFRAHLTAFCSLCVCVSGLVVEKKKKDGNCIDTCSAGD